MSNEMKDWLADKADDRTRLDTANWCCEECGEYWGEAPQEVRIMSRLLDSKCGVCLAEGVTVYPVRFWRYLRKRVEEEA